MAENSKGQYWTNERHVHYLNSMEASFVESMYQNKPLRLDRYLPDSSESTLDLPKERRTKTNSTADIVESSGTKTDRKSRISSSHKSSQDQVVPLFQKKRDDKDKD